MVLTVTSILIISSSQSQCDLNVYLDWLIDNDKEDEVLSFVNSNDKGWSDGGDGGDGDGSGWGGGWGYGWGYVSVVLKK